MTVAHNIAIYIVMVLNNGVLNFNKINKFLVNFGHLGDCLSIIDRSTFGMINRFIKTITVFKAN